MKRHIKHTDKIQTLQTANYNLQTTNKMGDEVIFQLEKDAEMFKVGSTRTFSGLIVDYQRQFEAVG